MGDLFRLLVSNLIQLVQLRFQLLTMGYEILIVHLNNTSVHEPPSDISINKPVHTPPIENSHNPELSRR